MNAYKRMAAAGLVLATLILATALGGLFNIATYAFERHVMGEQARAQDWYNLLILTPTVVLTGMAARRGAIQARILFAGAVVYAAYVLRIYALELQFNHMFWLYSTALALACILLLAIMSNLGSTAREDTAAPRGPSSHPGPNSPWKPSSSRRRPFSSPESIRHPSP